MQYKKSWASSNERIKARCKNRYFCCRGVRKTVCGHGRKGISLVAPHTRNALSRTARFSRVVVVTIIDRWIISESGGRGVGTGVRASEWVSATHSAPNLRLHGGYSSAPSRPDSTRVFLSSGAGARSRWLLRFSGDKRGQQRGRDVTRTCRSARPGFRRQFRTARTPTSHGPHHGLQIQPEHDGILHLWVFRKNNPAKF